MAISGSGGWISSQRYYINWKGELTTSGICQNKERSCVYSDVTVDAKGKIADAVPLLLAGQGVEIDVRFGQVWKLKELVSAI